MPGISTNRVHGLLATLVGKTAFTHVANIVHVGFCATTPTDAGGNITEPSTGGYVRKNITGANWLTPAGRLTNNTAEVNWDPASANWLSGVDLEHVVLWDHLTNAAEANFLGYNALTQPKPVLLNDPAKILVNQLVIAIPTA